MLFTEMREQFDKYNAFQNFLTVKQAKVLGLIPEDFAEYFPDYCECGSENIITTDLTIIECCDPRCPLKQPFGLANMFSRFSCKGIGEAVCKKAYDCIMKRNETLVQEGKEPLLVTDSYVEILTVPESAYPFEFLNSADGHSFLHYCNLIKQTEMTFPEMVSKLGLPEFDSISFTMFDKINSFDELRDTIMQEGGISSFCNNRHFYDPMKKFWLYISLKDIYVASCFFQRIRSMGVTTQQICITGSLNYEGHRITKKDFISVCNRMGVVNSNSNLLAQIITDKGEEWYRQYQTGIAAYCNQLGITGIPETYSELIDFLREFSDCVHPLLEVQMTQAKESVPYIVADSPSNSAKYLAGVRRGVEQDSDGRKRKVLVTSSEYLSIIKEMIGKWERNIQESMIQQIENQTMTYSPKQMTCF